MAGDHSHPKLPRTEVMRVASVALVDTRCVVRYLRVVHDGEALPLKSTTIAHVERALARCGYRALIDPESRYAAALAPAKTLGK